MIGMKRGLNELDPSQHCYPFFSPRDKDLFELERDVLARIVYKQHCAFRRINIIDRVKAVVRLLDKLLVSPKDMLSKLPTVVTALERASERFFQQLTMGLMIPISTVCLGSLARVAEIIKRIPNQISNPGTVTQEYFVYDDDEGIQIER
jgi:hypothetical protein